MTDMNGKTAHDVGPASQLEVGKFVMTEINGREIGITKLANGDIRAVWNYCPHRGAAVCKGVIGGTWAPSAPGQLEYEKDGEVLVCPWHGFEFDLDTGVELYRQKPSRLRLYPVEQSDGRVIVYA